MVTGGVYSCSVTHKRFEGVRRQFTYRMRLRLTDVSTLPARPHDRLSAIHPADHLGDPEASLSGNIESFLALNGVRLDGGRILLLSQSRGLGYVFDPVSIFWCYDAEDRLACLVAEVRNTFGDRHCYLLRLDAQGRARFDKVLYVTPFLPVDGFYRIRARLTTDSVDVVICLYRAGESGAYRAVLMARLSGFRVSLTGWRAALARLFNPMSARWTMVRIQYQAFLLRLRGLPIYRRRFHPPQPGTQASWRHNVSA